MSHPILRLVPDITSLPGNQEASDALGRWKGQGAEIVRFGSSFTGKPIEGALIGEGEKTLLAWGYPHADEPIGCAALIHLGDMWLAGHRIPGWRLVLIPVADPDGAERQKWLKAPGVTSYVEGSWRPSKLGFDLDYTHSVNLPYWKRDRDAPGACASITECGLCCESAVECALAETQSPPRPESMAIRTAFETFRPDLAAAMHNAHATGDYTYLLHREPKPVMRDLLRVPEMTGSLRHLGDRNDPGRRWMTAEPDLLKDFGESWAKRIVERVPGWKPGGWVEANAPIALLVDTEFSPCQMITPESPLFTGPFDDVDVTGRTEVIRVKVGVKNGRPYRWRSFQWRGAWKVFDQGPGESLEGEWTVPAPRSLLGMRAWLERARMFRLENDVWRGLDIPEDLMDHPWVIDRSRRTSMFNAGARRIFMLSKAYRETATVAQQATFEISWPIQTAARYAGFVAFLREEHPPGWEQALASVLKLQADVLDGLESRTADLSASVKSQLGRILLLLNRNVSFGRT